MAKGKSGRIVIEVDQGLKRRLRAALDLDGLTLKHWFITQAISYLEGHGQLKLDFRPTPPIDQKDND